MATKAKRFFLWPFGSNRGVGAASTITRVAIKTFVAGLMVLGGSALFQAPSLAQCPKELCRDSFLSFAPAASSHTTKVDHETAIVSRQSTASNQQPQDPTQDKSKAEAATALANQLYTEGSAGSLRKALEKYAEALVLYRAVADRRSEAITLSNLGVVYNDLGENQKAVDYYNQALTLWREVGDRSGEATTLSNLGTVYDALGEKLKALDYYNQALPLKRAMGDRLGEAITLSNLGKVYSDLGKKQKALDHFNSDVTAHACWR